MILIMIFAEQSTLKALPTSWFERLRNFFDGPKSPSTFKDFPGHASIYLKGGVDDADDDDA